MGPSLGRLSSRGSPVHSVTSREPIVYITSPLLPSIDPRDRVKRKGTVRRSVISDGYNFKDRRCRAIRQAGQGWKNFAPRRNHVPLVWGRTVKLVLSRHRETHIVSEHSNIFALSKGHDEVTARSCKLGSRSDMAVMHVIGGLHDLGEAHSLTVPRSLVVIADRGAVTKKYLVRKTIKYTYIHVRRRTHSWAGLWLVYPASISASRAAPKSQSAPVPS